MCLCCQEASLNASGAAALTEGHTVTLPTAHSSGFVLHAEMAEVHVGLFTMFWNPVTGGLLEFVFFKNRKKSGFRGGVHTISWYLKEGCACVDNRAIEDKMEDERVSGCQFIKKKKLFSACTESSSEQDKP